MNFFYDETEEELKIIIENINSLTNGIVKHSIENEKLYFKKIKKLILDLHNVFEFNSLAITELISIYNKFKKLNPDLKVILINVQPQVKNVLVLANIQHYFEIYES